ncbi:MAG: hypothetical protein WC442_01860 [Candidatus Omnitrophota bacterium]
MKKLIFILVSGLVLTGVFFNQAFAGKGAYCGTAKGEDKMEERLFGKASFILENSEELGLSEEQITKIKAVKINAKKSIIKSDAEIELTALEIKEALGKETADLNNINTLIDKKYNIKSQKAKTLVNACVELKKILNKDQAKKIKDMCMKSMKNDKCMMGSRSMMKDKLDRERMGMNKD